MRFLSSNITLISCLELPITFLELTYERVKRAYAKPNPRGVLGEVGAMDSSVSSNLTLLLCPNLSHCKEKT